MNRLKLARTAYIKYSDDQGLDGIHTPGASVDHGPASGASSVLLTYSADVSAIMPGDTNNSFQWSKAIWFTKGQSGKVTVSVSNLSPVAPKSAITSSTDYTLENGTLVPASHQDKPQVSPLQNGTLTFDTEKKYIGPGTVYFINVKNDPQVEGNNSLAELAGKFSNDAHGDVGIYKSDSVYPGADFFSTEGASYRISVDGKNILPWNGAVDPTSAAKPETTDEASKEAMVSMSGSGASKGQAVADPVKQKAYNAELAKTKRLTSEISKIK